MDVQPLICESKIYYNFSQQKFFLFTDRNIVVAKDNLSEYFMANKLKTTTTKKPLF